VKEIPISPDETGGGLPMNIVNEIVIMRDAWHPNLMEYHGSRLTETAHGGTVAQIVMGIRCERQPRGPSAPRGDAARTCGGHVHA
jgi:hypothetical protein